VGTLQLWSSLTRSLRRFVHCSGPSGELARLAVSTLSLKYLNLVTARILNKKEEVCDRPRM
jgi:hypothetical protein